MAVDRRRFVALSGLTALGVAGKRALSQPEDDDTARVGEPAGPPLTGKRWAMVVDVQRCLNETDCTDCQAACHAVHNVPRFDNPKDEVKWIWKESFQETLPEQYNDYLDERLRAARLLVFCNHCDNPPCVRVCPTQATWKRDDGVVMMDWHRCIGCRYCMAACPYGSRSFNWRDPRPHIAEIDPGFPTRTRGVVEKCNLCEERLARGERPACVEACKGKALLFGDLEDPESEVRAALRSRPAVRRRVELGTQPEIYYLL